MQEHSRSMKQVTSMLIIVSRYSHTLALHCSIAHSLAACPVAAMDFRKDEDVCSFLQVVKAAGAHMDHKGIPQSQFANQWDVVISVLARRHTLHTLPSATGLRNFFCKVCEQYRQTGGALPAAAQSNAMVRDILAELYRKEQQDLSTAAQQHAALAQSNSSLPVTPFTVKQR